MRIDQLDHRHRSAQLQRFLRIEFRREGVVRDERHSHKNQTGKRY
jgi:hypothetical protein